MFTAEQRQRCALPRCSLDGTLIRAFTVRMVIGLLVIGVGDKVSVRSGTACQSEENIIK